MAKKKAAGNPQKGEKIFKNLCAVCHALAVSDYSFSGFERRSYLFLVIGNKAAVYDMPLT